MSAQRIFQASGSSKVASTVDFEEIEDRIVEMIDSLHKLEQTSTNQDLFKIILSAYCVEKAKLLSMLYPLEDRGEPYLIRVNEINEKVIKLTQ